MQGEYCDFGEGHTLFILQRRQRLGVRTVNFSNLSCRYKIQHFPSQFRSVLFYSLNNGVSLSPQQTPLHAPAQLFTLYFATTQQRRNLDQTCRKAEAAGACPSGHERRRVGAGEGGGVRRRRSGGGETDEVGDGDGEAEEGLGGFVLWHRSWTESNERNES